MDEDLFLKKMKGVKPFNKEKSPNTKKVASFKNKKKTKEAEQSKATEINKNHKEQTKPEPTFTFNDINKDLKKGRINIDRRIDLHGYTLLEAQEKLRAEIIKTHTNNKRCILVITGKGSYINKDSEVEKPRLFYGKIKNSIISWINENELKKYILTYQDAGFEHGGDGAIFIYLRKKRN